jgi:hypothetical protein
MDIPERDFIWDYFMVNATWLSLKRESVYGPTFFSDWVNNVYEFISIYNQMVGGVIPPTERLHEFWGESIRTKDSWKTRDPVVNSQAIGAKAVRVGKAREATYPDGQFGTYGAMAKWKGLVKKIVVRMDYPRGQTAAEAMEVGGYGKAR